jgi:hypothetical protein
VDLLSRIAESKIREAMADGAFDHLVGRGRPLRLDDFSRVPEELRVAHKVLKNAGVLPEELQLRKEMARLDGLIAHTGDGTALAELRRRRLAYELRYSLLMERRARRRF